MNLPTWSPASWRQKRATQQPNYRDPDDLKTVLEELHQRPPLVTSFEVERLKSRLALASQGRAFLLQGGDCSESFDDCKPRPIEQRLKLLLQMSLVLIHGLKKPVVRVGRIAGQYAKPRSKDLETRNGIELPSYRGDIVNGFEFTESARVPDPNRMLRAYDASVATLNYMRALTEGGYADLHHHDLWQLGFVTQSVRSQQYHQMVQGIDHSIQFLDAIGATSGDDLSKVDFYASHEALLLPYEESLTRRDITGDRWYNLGTHFPWIGDRTRGVDEAHVEYMRGIQNPIGIKVGPSMDPESLPELLEILDPNREPGRITLICRFGVSKIDSCLPKIIEAVKETEHPVLWTIDPMHGNTVNTDDGIKTRHFDHILGEVQSSFQIHKNLGTNVGGIHLELTGKNVTECVGGSSGLGQADLETAYETKVDPRLNYDQAMEIAFLIAE